MLAVDRRLRILEQVAEDQSIHVSDLAVRFGVSEMTVRRDIRRLERDGFLKQTYGGATAHLTRSFDLSFDARALHSAREKRLIAMTASALVGDARMLYLGIGTTVEQFARYVPVRPDLTIVTASVTVASLLGTRPVRTMILGGTVEHEELTCIGPVALATLQRFRFDVAVVGVAGISARWGLTDLSHEDAEVSRAALARSDRTIVLAHGDKFGMAASSVVGPATVATVIVTDGGVPADERAAIEALGVEVVVATPAAPGAHAATAAGRA